MEENRKISFPFIILDRGISDTTGIRIIDAGPLFYFDAGPGDRSLHEQFVKKYKKGKKKNVYT